MSGSALLPVGGFPTITTLKAGLGVQVPYTFMVLSASLTTTAAWYTGSIVTATVGMSVPFACTMKSISSCGHCSAQVGTPTLTVTLWKTNQTAGSEVFTATSAAVATGVGIGPFSSSTVVNSGKDAFAANDIFLISALSAATSATIVGMNFCVWMQPL